MNENFRESNRRIQSTLGSILGEIDSYFEDSSFDEVLDIKNLLTSQIKTGIMESELMKLSYEYFDVLEAKDELHSYHKRHLLAENLTLRNEIDNLRSALEKSELQVVELEEENKTLNMKLDLGISEKCPNCNGNDTVKVNSMVSEYAANSNQALMISQNGESTREDDSDLMFQSQYGVPSGTSPEIATRLKTLHNLVLQYKKCNKFDVAVPLCRQAINDIQEAKGKDHQDVATLINILACVYRDQGKLKEASNLLHECLEIRQKCFGPNNPIVASTLNNLVVLYGRRSKFREAEPLCKRALEIRESVLGPNHPEVAKQLNNFALLCQKMGKFDEASEYFQRAEEIYTKTMGRTNPCVLKIIGFRTISYSRRAWSIYDQADRIHYLADLIRSITCLASVYMEKRDFEEAEKLYKELINRVHEKEFSIDGSRTDPVKNRSIWMLAEDRQYDRAVGTDLSNLQFKMQTSELMHNPIVIGCLKNLASLYKRQGKGLAAEILESSIQEIPLTSKK